MALISKAEASRLSGASRTTIHKYTKDGTLSMVGSKIDTAELSRVFPEIRLDISKGVGKSSISEQRTDGNEQVIILLREQLAKLEQQLEKAEQRIATAERKAEDAEQRAYDSVNKVNQQIIEMVEKRRPQGLLAWLRG
jgi:DNA-binding transcriptional MerR regulator